MRISASAISDYLKCPQMYLLRTTLKEEAEISQDLLVGTLFHTVAEKNWEHKFNSRDFVMNIPDFDLLESKKVDKLFRCIDVFDSGMFDGQFFAFSDDDKVEHWFSLPFGSDLLVGKIDRILSGDILIDWKTSSTAPTENSIKRDIQFIIYDYAYEKLFGRRASLYCVNVNTNKVVRYKRDKMVFDYFFGSGIYKILEEIKKSDFPFWGLFNGSCYMCKYKQSCIGGN